VIITRFEGNPYRVVVEHIKYSKAVPVGRTAKASHFTVVRIYRGVKQTDPVAFSEAHCSTKDKFDPSEGFERAFQRAVERISDKGLRTALWGAVKRHLGKCFTVRA